VGITRGSATFNCGLLHVAGSTLSALMALVAGGDARHDADLEAGPALEMMERERCTLIRQRHAPSRC